MRIAPGLSRIKEMTLDLLFPPHCLGCGVGGSFLCSSCQEALPRLNPPYCERCGLPVAEGDLCATCQVSPPALDGLRSPFLFQGVVRQAIHCLKYQNLRAVAWPLGQLLGECLRVYPLPVEVLVPVPLHPKRLRQRGYNQSALLARATGLPVVEGLIRLRDTPPQARTATSQERQDNVRGAFACRHRGLRGRQILLVDDVCTTGATMEACALALKEAGAASVWGLALAREI